MHLQQIVVVRARAMKDAARSAALILIEIRIMSGTTTIATEIVIMNIEIGECDHEVTEGKRMGIVWDNPMFTIVMNIITKVIGTPGTIGRDTGRGIRSDSAKEDTIVRAEVFFFNIVTPPTEHAFSFPLEDRT